MNKPTQWMIGVLISVGAVLLAVRGVNLAEAAQALRQADYRYVAPAVILIFVGLVARSLSWHSILGGDVSRQGTFLALNEGYLLNNLLPFRLGEVARAYLVSRSQNLPVARALSSVLVERMVDLCMVLGLLGGLVPVVTGQVWARDAALGSVALTVVVYAALFWVAGNPKIVLNVSRRVFLLSRLEGQVSIFIEGMATLRNGRHFAVVAFWSAIAWLTAGVANWLLLVGFVPHATLSMAFFALVISALGVAVPSAPGYVGVFEAAVVAALAVFNVDRSLAFSYALALHAVNFAVPSLIGAVALAREGESLAHLAQAAQALLAGLRRESGAPPSAA